MRGAALALLTAALLGLLIFVNRDTADDLGGSGAGEPAGQQEVPTDQGPADPVIGMPTPLETKPPGPAPDGGRTEFEPYAMTGPMRSFHGTALLQLKDQLVREAGGGTLEIDLIGGGKKSRVQAVVAAGRFDVEVPVSARLILISGKLDGRDVYFEKPKGPFDPTDDDYALVGIAVPEFKIVVRDGPTGAPLRSISIHRAEGITSAWLQGDPFDGDLIVSDEPSPITLPHIESTRPVWLRITSAGYAGAHVNVNPNEEGLRNVLLWPSADLTVRVTGPGRHRLSMLLFVYRDDQGRNLHEGTFDMTHPNKLTTPDSVTFPVMGLKGMKQVITAKGLNAKRQLVTLGTLEVPLGPRESKSVGFPLE